MTELALPDLYLCRCLIFLRYLLATISKHSSCFWFEIGKIS